MSQYAIEGYSVKAFGFLEKPISYESLKRELDSAIRSLSKTRNQSISIRYDNKVDVLDSSKIIYIEVYNHVTKIYLEDETKSYRISLSEIEELLSGRGFFRCHASYIINYQFIKKINIDNVLMIDDSVVPISRHRKKDLLKDFSIYMSNI